MLIVRNSYLFAYRDTFEHGCWRWLSQLDHRAANTSILDGPCLDKELGDLLLTLIDRVVNGWALLMFVRLKSFVEFRGQVLCRSLYLLAGGWPLLLCCRTLEHLFSGRDLVVGVLSFIVTLTMTAKLFLWISLERRFYLHHALQGVCPENTCIMTSVLWKVCGSTIKRLFMSALTII